MKVGIALLTLALTGCRGKAARSAASAHDHGGTAPTAPGHADAGHGRVPGFAAVEVEPERLQLLGIRTAKVPSPTPDPRRPAYQAVSRKRRRRARRAPDR